MNKDPRWELLEAKNQVNTLMNEARALKDIADKWKREAFKFQMLSFLMAIIGVIAGLLMMLVTLDPEIQRLIVELKECQDAR